MRRVLQYIIGEVKEGRLAKSSAVELTREISAQIAPAELAVLHPLLHRNTSDLSALRFSTRLSGEEFYLRDHVVGGRKILPAVAHLELARAAVSAAAGEDEQGGVSLQQVTWILAASQLLVICVPIALSILKAFAIGIIAVLAIVALVLVFTRKPA